jgi:acyl-CoA synthetase (AMP-forming)/AMP-acid ligase II
MATTLLELLYRNTGRNPAAEAIVHGERRETYGSLWARVQAFGTDLMQRGARPGDRVVVVLENSPEFVAAYYGTHFAGGAVVALNTQAKSRDLANWIRHCGARWLVMSEKHPEFAELRSALEAGVTVLPQAPSAVAAASDPRPVARDDLAAIIYTSGTTGDPKGVMLSHGNLTANVESIVGYLKLRASDRVMHVLPCFYSYGNSVLHTHLAAGACIVFENSLMYPQVVLQRMVRERVTAFSGVPSTFAVLLSRANLRDFDLTSVRYLSQAGGPLPPAQIERTRAAFPNAEFFVMYGQTEATARICDLPPERLDEKLGTVGLPIPGVEVEVRDADDHVLPAGDVGEICVRGPNIMLGYWNNPGATGQTVRNGWLHTGHLARRDADGYIRIEGRQSDMIKAGAHRISPKEIEEAIAELPGVAEVAVAGMPDEVLGEAIVAFIVPVANAGLEQRTVQAHCRARLAQYKIPKSVRLVDALRKTASGKVRRHLLKVPAASG